MKQIFPSLILILAFCINSSYKPAEAVVGGVVISTEGKPLEGVYVYIIKGQEETLTDKKGRFQLQTWQSFPVTLYIYYNGRLQKEQKIDRPENNLRIILNTP